MRCTQCRGTIERPSSICPHCGAALSGVQKLRSRIEPSGPTTAERPDGRRATNPDRSPSDANAQITELFTQARDFILRDTKTTILSGMVAGAIIGRIMGLGWVIGSIFGGFVTFKILEKK